MKINNKKMLVISVLLMFTLLIVIVIDFILSLIYQYDDTIIRILETILSSGSALTLSLTLKVSIESNYINIDKKSKLSNIGNKSLLSYNTHTIINENIHDDSFNVSANNSSVNLINVNNDLNSFMEIAKNVLIPFELNNVQSIVDKSIEALINNPINQPLSREFLLKYIEESKTISEQDIQNIWVKLLVQEATEKDSVSKRTLDIIKNLKPSEAKLFEKVASYSDEKGIISKVFEDNFVFIEMSLLQDIGLIKSNDMLSSNVIIPSNQKKRICHNNDYVLFLENHGNIEEKYTMSCYVLTTEGLEIKKALNIYINNENIIELGRKIKKSQKNININCLLYKVYGITDSVISFDDSKNFLE